MVPLCSILVFVELKKKSCSRAISGVYLKLLGFPMKLVPPKKKGGFKMLTNRANHLGRNTDITQTSLTRGWLWWEQEGGVAV